MKKNLWILHISHVDILKSFAFNIIANEWMNPGAHQNIVSPAGPLFVCTTKGGGPRQGGEKVVIGQFGDNFLRMMDR